MSVTFPAPYFGAKKKAAAEVWRRFGNPRAYVEPFAGSLAVLLNRPDEHVWWERVEAVGDFDGLVANFHRSVAADPKTVAFHASWPITEVDLTARHLFLVRYADELAEKLATDPDFYDVRAAGWWVWGISAWVGGEWCSGLGPWKPGDPDGPGVFRKMPMIHGSHSGRGVHRQLERAAGSSSTVAAASQEQIERALTSLSNRLRRVRVTCGDWERLTKGAITVPDGSFAAVLLDPPYDLNLRRASLYGKSDIAVDGGAPVHERARQWALQQTSHPSLRVAYCSYSTDKEDDMFTSAGWSPHRWTASGGYGLQSDNVARENREREVIWFSPQCDNEEDTPSPEIAVLDSSHVLF